MVISDYTLYTIEANRAIFEQRLREANYARLVNQFRRGSVTQLIGVLTALIVVHRQLK